MTYATRYKPQLFGRSSVYLLVLLALVAAVGATIYAASGHLLTASAATHLMQGISVASAFVPVMPRSKAELDAMSKPRGATSRSFRAPYYDTQLFTSGTTTSLVYFGSINGDKTMSNQRGNGGITPNDYYIEPLYINFDYLAGASLAGASTQVGVLDDINKLIFVNRGILVLTVGDIVLPEIPLSYLHASGGANGVIGATLTAPNAVQVGQNGVQDSGYCIAGSFLFAPGTPFKAEVKFSATSTLNAGNTNCRLSFDCNWHVPVA